MAEQSIIGWDIGGAHLKVARVTSTGQVISANQYAMPLWQGIDKLGVSLQRVNETLTGLKFRHAVTTTGELVDIFPNRNQGVKAITECMQTVFTSDSVQYYAGNQSWLNADSLAGHYQSIASANWHATASYVASCVERGILLDIGSTTTDIIKFDQGKLLNKGYSDYERLALGELVYTGVTRTPVMAIADIVSINDQQQPLMAELFATMADVYRVLELLDENDDMYPSVDGTGKSRFESARRLARMTGQDFDTTDDIQIWQNVADQLANKQKLKIQLSLEKMIQNCDVDNDVTIIGAGAGRFLAKSIAQNLSMDYMEFADLLDAEKNLHAEASRAAPAVAVALLARQSPCL